MSRGKKKNLSQVNGEEVRPETVSTAETPVKTEMDSLLEEAATKINSLNEVVTTLRNENDELKSQIKALNVDIDNYKETIKAMKANSARNDRAVIEMEAEINELRKLNEDLESKIEVIKELNWKDRTFHWKDIVKGIG